MTNVYSTTEAQELDRVAIERFGIPSLVLMENAARGVCDVLLERSVDLADATVVIACGRGNNGGDGLALARQLMIHGAFVRCVVVDERDRFSEDAGTQLKTIESLDPEVLVDWADVGALDAIAFDVVVDALLGTGSRGAPRGNYALAVEWLNDLTGLHVALDLPTGLDGDTGRAASPVFMADATATMAALKIGLLINDGVDVAGDVYTVHIGLPPDAYPISRCSMLDDESARERLPVVESTRHKYQRGKVLVIGGSRDMLGAPALAAEAALHTGAGLTVLATPKQVTASMHRIPPEVMTRTLAAGDDGAFSTDAIEELKDELATYSVIALGPGISKSSDAATAVRQLVGRSTIPIVLDADGLNAFAGAIVLLGEHECDLVITPHHGEMARLLGCDAAAVTIDPIAAARDAASRANVTVVLKGAPTVVAMADGRTWINGAGNPGMATGGSGDVLTGMIASMIAQGAGIESATLSAVYLHSLAADIAVAESTERAMVATDIIRSIPAAYRALAVESE